MQFLTFITTFILLIQLKTTSGALEAGTCDYTRYESGCPGLIAECDDSVCTCPPTTPITINAGDGYPICLDQKQFNEECYVNEQCESEEISGMECAPISGEDADIATNSIREELGSKNVSSEIALHKLTAENSGTCQCKQGYFVGANDSESVCIRSRRHGEACSKDEECTHFDLNSSCRPMHRFNACSCNAGFAYVKAAKSCVESVTEKTVIIETDVVDDSQGDEEVVVINCTYYDRKRRLCTDLSSAEDHEHSNDEDFDGTNEDGQMLGMIVGIICLITFAGTSMWFCCCKNQEADQQLRQNDTRRISPHDLARFYRHLARTSTPRVVPARSVVEKLPTPTVLSTIVKPLENKNTLVLSVSPATDHLYWQQMDRMGSRGSLPTYEAAIIEATNKKQGEQV